MPHNTELPELYANAEKLLANKKAEIRYWQDNIRRAIGDNSFPDFENSKMQLVTIAGDTFTELFREVETHYCKRADEKFFLSILYNLDLLSAGQMLDKNNSDLIYAHRLQDNPYQYHEAMILKGKLETLLKDNIGIFPNPHVRKKSSRLLQLILKVAVFSPLSLAESIGAVGFSNVLTHHTLPLCTEPASAHATLSLTNWLAFSIVFFLNLFFYLSINIPGWKNIKHFSWTHFFKIILALLFDISAITLAYNNWGKWGCYFDFGKLETILPMGITISILNGVKAGLEQISNLDKFRMAVWSLKINLQTSYSKADKTLYLLKTMLRTCAAIVLNMHMLIPLTNFNVLAYHSVVDLVNHIFGTSYHSDPSFRACFGGALILAVPALVGSSDVMRKIEEAVSIGRQFGIKHSFRYAVKGLNKWNTILVAIVATILSAAFGFYGQSSAKAFYSSSGMGENETLGQLIFSLLFGILIGGITLIGKASETKANTNYILRELTPQTEQDEQTPLLPSFL